MPIANVLYPQYSSPHPQHQHQHHTHLRQRTPSGHSLATRQAQTYSTYSAHSNGTTDSFYSNSSTLTPMTTDDDASSTASRRPRTRLLSSPGGGMPSPLGTYAYTSGNHSTGNIHHHRNHHPHLHERSASSSLPFSSSSAPTSSSVPSSPAQVRLAPIDLNPKTTTIQLKVKHLTKAVVHSGYLSKYVPRTFFSRKQWKRRYFILDKRSLHCFKSSDPRHPLLESIELCAEANVYVTDTFPGKRYCIQISCPNERDWFVLADTASEMSAWLRELKAIVNQFRNVNLVGETGSHFSEVSTASASSASGQDHHYHPLQSAAGDTLGRPSSRSSSPLSRPIDPYQHQHGQMTSLNPPPRSLTPKPPTSIPASSVRSTASEREGTSTHTNTTRRRNNSNVSTGAHSVNDYLSIESVMAQAGAMNLSEANNNYNFGEKSLQQLKQEHYQRQQQQQQQQQAEQQQDEAQDDYTNGRRDYEESANGHSRPSSPKPATLPRSARESRIPFNYSHRASVSSDRSDTMSAILPRRSSQRMSAAGPPRPMSPGALSRQGTFSNRPSPRNSFVVSPPPRSIHRPPSMSVRHSTQIVLPHHIQTDFANHPIMSKPPTQSLPATPDSADSNGTFNGSLSRITSIRHQRELALSRQCSISSLAPVGSPSTRPQVVSPRASVLSINSSVHSGITSPLSSSVVSSSPMLNRPMSPIPSLADAPTQPLPEPPKDQQPSISRTPSLSTEPTPARRISVVPRHHQPDLILPARSKGRARSQSNEGTSQAASAATVADVVAASSHEDIQIARRAVSPPPRLSAVLPSGSQPPRSADGGETASTSLISPKGPRASRQLHSLPIRTLYNLPAPPTGQPPSPQGSNMSNTSTSTSSSVNATNAGASAATSAASSQLQQAHRRALSSSSTYSSYSIDDGSEGNGVAVFGGAVARKSSSQHRRFLSGGGSSSSSESAVIVTPRLSALLGNGMHVPLPPTTALPPVPASIPLPCTPSPPPIASSPRQLQPSPSPVPSASSPSPDQTEATNSPHQQVAETTEQRVAMPQPLPAAAAAIATLASKGSTIAPIAEEDEEEAEPEHEKMEEKEDVQGIRIISVEEASGLPSERATDAACTDERQIESLEIKKEAVAGEAEEAVPYVDDDDSEMDEVDVEDLTITVSKSFESGSILPAYYASKEEGVVDYIFPSEAKAVVTAMAVPMTQEVKEEEDDEAEDD